MNKLAIHLTDLLDVQAFPLPIHTDRTQKNSLNRNR